MDNTGLKLFVVDDRTRLPIGCPVLTYIIDHNCSGPLGYYASFTPASYLTVMKCLKHAIQPKTYIKDKYPSVSGTWDMYGVPSLLVVDNGPDFVSKSLVDAAKQIGTTVQYCPTQMPWYKGKIERHFNTLNSDFLRDKPGANLTHLLDRSDYDPEKNAVISLSKFHELLHLWIVDVFLREVHGKMTDTPANIWTEGTKFFPPALPREPRDLDVLPGHQETRSVNKYGIEWNGLLYNCDALKLVRRHVNDEPTQIKFDPEDIGFVHVFDPKERMFVPAPALEFEYASGLSIWQHEVIRRLARQKVEGIVDGAALRRAKAKIQDIVEREYLCTKGRPPRKKMARWLKEGQKNSTQHDSPPALGKTVAVSTFPEKSLTDVEKATWNGVAGEPPA